MGLSKSVISNFISKILGSVAGFIATFAIARLLGAEVLGIYALAQGLVVWATVPSHGVSTATTKYISEGNREREFASTGILFNLLLITVVTVFFLFFKEQLNRYIGAEAGLLVLLLICSSVLFGTIGGLLTGKKKVSEFGWLTTGENALRTIFQVIFILSGYKISGLIVGHAGSLVIASILGIYFLNLRPAFPSWDAIGKMYNYVKYSWLGSTKRKMFGWMDTIVLGFFVSSAFIGIYEVAWTLSSFLILSSNSIRDVLFPEISELSSKGKEDEILWYVSKSILYTGVITIPGFFGAAVVGSDLLSIYGLEFAKGATVLPILILAQLANVYGKQFVDVLNAINRPDAAFRVNAAFVITNLSLNFLLIYAIGWYGAAVATLASGIVTLILGTYYLGNLLGSVSIPWKGILYQVFSSVIMSVGVLYIKSVAPSNLYATIGVIFAGVLLYTIVLLSFSSEMRCRFFEAATFYK